MSSSSTKGVPAGFAARNPNPENPSLWIMTTKQGSSEGSFVSGATGGYWEQDLLRFLSKPQLMSLSLLLGQLLGETLSHLDARERNLSPRSDHPEDDDEHSG
jgi:hypothetical protein